MCWQKQDGYKRSTIWICTGFLLQGKQGKLWNVIPDRETTRNLNILNKHRENTGNLKIKETKSKWKQYTAEADKMTRQCWWFKVATIAMFIMKIHRESWNDTGKSKHRWNVVNFTFRDEWESCLHYKYWLPAKIRPPYVITPTLEISMRSKLLFRNTVTVC